MIDEIKIKEHFTYVDGLLDTTLTRRGNSLLATREKLIELRSNNVGSIKQINMSVAGSDIGKMSVFSKFDNSTIVTQIKRNSDYTNQLRTILPLNGQNQQLTGDSFKIKGNELYINVESVSKVRKLSKNQNFSKLKNEIIENRDVMFAQLDGDDRVEKRIKFVSTSVNLNDIQNLLNKTSFTSESYGAPYRFNLSEASKRSVKNPRGILERTSNPEYFIYSTSPDLIKILSVLRGFKVEEIGSSLTSMVDNNDFIFDRNISVRDVTEYTFNESQERDAQTLIIFDDGKNSRTTVELANIILNKNIVKFPVVDIESKSFIYYASNIDLKSQQKYNKCIIYTANKTLIESYIKTIDFVNYTPETLNDCLNYLTSTTGNSEDVHYCDTIVGNLKSISYLMENGDMMQLPDQSYPLPIGFFYSANQINSVLTKQSEYSVIVGDSYSSKSIELSKDLYLFTHLKHYSLDSSNSKMNGQEKNTLNKFLKEFFTKPFTYTEFFMTSPWSSSFDLFIDQTNLSDKFDSVNKLERKEERDFGTWSMKLFGGDYFLSEWLFSKQLPGLSQTSQSSFVLFCERYKNRTLVTHYDIDTIMQSLKTGVSTKVKFEQTINVADLSSNIDSSNFEIISSNKGLEISIVCKSSKISKLDNKSHIIGFNKYGENTEMQNKQSQQVGIDYNMIQTTGSTLYTLLKEGRNTIMENETTKTWLESVSSDVVRYDLKIVTEMLGEGKYILQFVGTEINVVKKLNKQFKNIILVKTYSKPRIDNEARKPFKEGVDFAFDRRNDDTEGGQFNLAKGSDLNRKIGEFESKPIVTSYKLHDKSFLSKSERGMIKAEKITKHYNNQVIESVIDGQIDLLPVEDELGNNNCAYDAVNAILPKSKKKNELVKMKLKSCLQGYEHGVKIKHVKIADAIQFLIKNNVSCKILIIDDINQRLELISIGNICSDKIICYCHNGEVWHCQAYKLNKNIFNERLWYKIRQYDLFGIGYSNYLDKPDFENLDNMIISYIYN